MLSLAAGATGVLRAALGQCWGQRWGQRWCCGPCPRGRAGPVQRSVLGLLRGAGSAACSALCMCRQRAGTEPTAELLPARRDVRGQPAGSMGSSAQAVCGQGWAVCGKGARGSALARHQEQDEQAAALALCRDRQRAGSARAVLRAARAGRALAGPRVWAARGRAQAVCGQCPGSVGSVEAAPAVVMGQAGHCSAQCGVRWRGVRTPPRTAHTWHMQAATRFPAPSVDPSGSGITPGPARCCWSPVLTEGAARGPVPGARAGAHGGGPRPLPGHRPLCQRCPQVSHPRSDTVWARRVGRLVPAESGQCWGQREHPTYQMPTKREAGEQQGMQNPLPEESVSEAGGYVTQ